AFLIRAIAAPRRRALEPPRGFVVAAVREIAAAQSGAQLPGRPFHLPQDRARRAALPEPVEIAFAITGLASAGGIAVAAARTGVVQVAAQPLETALFFAGFLALRAARTLARVFALWGFARKTPSLLLLRRTLRRGARR